MQEILIIALILAGGYYLAVYLPQQEKSEENIKPTTHSQSTQTEPLINEDEKELEPILDELITNIKKLNKEIK